MNDPIRTATAELTVVIPEEYPQAPPDPRHLPSALVVETVINVRIEAPQQPATLLNAVAASVDTALRAVGHHPENDA